MISLLLAQSENINSLELFIDIHLIWPVKILNIITCTTICRHNVNTVLEVKLLNNWRKMIKNLGKLLIVLQYKGNLYLYQHLKRD